MSISTLAALAARYYSRMVQRVIVITGASSGVGKKFIELAGRALPNDQVIALSHTPHLVSPAANVGIVTVDITSSKDRERAIKDVLRRYHRIDVFIHNAGNGLRSTIEDATLREINEQLAVNFWPALHYTQLVLPSMRKQQTGHIIILSSLAATLDYPTLGYYSMAKLAIEKLHNVLALEVAQWGIHVSTIQAGPIASRFGSNMTNARKLPTTEYADTYTLWRRKFTKLFNHASSCEDVAVVIARLIDRPRRTVLVRRRDAIFSALYRVLGPRIFAKYFIDLHMR